MSQANGPEPLADVLSALSDAYRARDAAKGEARGQADERIHQALADVVAGCHRPCRQRIDGPPPRRVAVAMALALFGQPHLSATLFGYDAEPDAPRPPDGWPVGDPFVLSNEVMEKSLGLTQWELDDLREEVDRRVGRALKQARALEWLWTHFGLPEASPFNLFRVLFPGASGRLKEVSLVRHGAQLYALVEQARAPALPSLFLGWIPHHPEDTFPPLNTFRSRYVDHGLRRALCRGVGADDIEADWLLDQMVTILPRDDTERFLARDGWRSRGIAAMVGLGLPYSASCGLTEPVKADEILWGRWIETRDAGVVLDGRATEVFDALAVPRVQEMMRHVYTAMLSCMAPGASSEGFELEVFDLGQHLRAVLDPLLTWARSDEVHQDVAHQLDRSKGAVSELLLDVARQWEEHLQTTWVGVPAGRRTIQGILTAHLAAVHGSMREMLGKRPDRRWDHRVLLLLFAAHYLAEARLERLWLRGMSDAVSGDAPLRDPEDIPGRWFWGTWRRILDAVDAESSATLSSF